MSSFWRNKDGQVVVWQTPNVPLWAWLVFTVLARFTKGIWHNVSHWIALAAIIIWSALELFKGQSGFRRLLGAVVLAMSLYGIIKGLH